MPVVVLALAFALRTWQLAESPPGLTHDEAGHGHDAAYILRGVTPIYFTIGYGREPLFDYINAGWMALLGANPFTLRFAAAGWGMIALAATYRAARLAFEPRTALIALALMAVSFWPLATSRQILRSAMLPAEMALAVICFLKLSTAKRSGAKGSFIFGLGLAVAASLYTYLPARALWLIFPFAALTQNKQYAIPNTQYSKPDIGFTLHVLLACLIAFALASPLFLYLYQNPQVEQRLSSLSGPLVALQNGDYAPLLNNSRDMLMAFVIPGHGDYFLAYTIPGKPIFDPVLFIFFILGLVFLLADLRSTRHTSRSAFHVLRFTLIGLWLVLGLAPSFMTGPEALTTRSIGAQPLLYILPAVAVSRLLPSLRRYGIWLLGLGILTLCAMTIRDYFFVWAQSPDVRAAYRSTTIAIARSLAGPTVVSTLYPSAPHDPYIAELITARPTRWVDARFALLIPAGSDFQLAAPASTPLHPFLARFLRPAQTVALRPTDLDSSFTFYDFTFHDFAGDITANFNNAIKLADSRWSADSYHPGDLAELVTVWRVLDPSRLGRLHPPAFKTDLTLFTHVLNSDGSIFLQRDALDAPSWDWQTGDLIIQIHQFTIPADAAAGDSPTEVGLYDRITGDRLPVLNSDATSAFVSPLMIR